MLFNVLPFLFDQYPHLIQESWEKTNSGENITGVADVQMEWNSLETRTITSEDITNNDNTVYSGNVNEMSAFNLTKGVKQRKGSKDAEIEVAVEESIE